MGIRSHIEQYPWAPGASLRTGARILAAALAVALLASPARAVDFVRGDVTDDGAIDIADPISGLGYLFGGATVSIAPGEIEAMFTVSGISAGTELITATLGSSVVSVSIDVID